MKSISIYQRPHEFLISSLTCASACYFLNTCEIPSQIRVPASQHRRFPWLWRFQDYWRSPTSQRVSCLFSRQFRTGATHVCGSPPGAACVAGYISVPEVQSQNISEKIRQAFRHPECRMLFNRPAISSGGALHDRIDIVLPET
jgi:hypothetical protein